MADFYDITDWNEKPFFQTKGTRSKCVVSNPDDNFDYYFKTSMKKEGKDYKTEFWSEIIASEIGAFLGFNVLKYDIAKNGSEIGCISKSMNNEEECLTEGISLLTGYDNTYNPDDKESYSTYTFHFIKLAIESYNLGECIKDIIKTIIFDSLIGNSDRHQENWGFITPYQERKLTEVEASGVIKKIIERIRKIKGEQAQELNADNVKINATIKIMKMIGRYAPIYDSGCCLAREKTDEAAKQLLKDNIMFDSFINRGKAEIRWGSNGDKLNHFELIKNIRIEFSDVVDDEINRIISIFDQQKVEAIVSNVDNQLPEEYKQIFGLSDHRKRLICKIVERRFEKLKGVII